jgi:hypothetical protein
MASHPRKLSPSGFTHLLIPILVVIVIALLGGLVYDSISKAATIANSVSFTSGVGSSKCMDDAYDSKANYTKVQLYSCNKNASQQWIVNTNGTIENANGSCLDLSGAKYTNNTKIVMYSCNTNAAQQWKLSNNTIVNPKSGKCLDDPYSTATNGTQLIIYTCKGTTNQKWTPSTTVSQPGGSGSGGSNGTLAACTQSGQTTVTGATKTTVYATIAAPSGNMEPTIQSAINSASASGGGIVKIGAGTYELDSRLTMASNVELEGAGKTTTILQAAETNMGIVTTNGASNTTLADFTADQNGQNLNSASGGGNPGYYEVDIDGGSNNIVEEVQLINPVNYMLDEENGSSAFCMRDNTIIVNGSESKYSNDTYANLDGIHIDGGTNGDVLDNYIDQRENGATDGDDALVAQGYESNESYVDYIGNIARGGNNGDCMQFAFGPGSISHVTVSDNELYGCTFGIRTGGYNPGGSVTNVTISNNNIHNIVPGAGKNGSFSSGGEAIELGGFLTTNQTASSNTVSNNYVCDAGSVVAESGTTITGTNNYTSCSDAATSTNPPPVMP